MGKQSSAWIATQHKKRWPLMILILLSLSTAMAFLIRSIFDSCTTSSSNNVGHFIQEKIEEEEEGGRTDNPVNRNAQAPSPNPLDFMKSKLVLLVSHELTLSGGPLLSMELAFLLRGVGAEVVWVTNQKPSQPDDVMYSLEHKMLDRGVQVFSAKGQESVNTALKADLVILNTAVAGKWLDAVLKEHVAHVLKEHFQRFSGAMIDSHTTANYWKNRTQERLGIKMPETYVVHLGNSEELQEVAENRVAKRILCGHVRESLGVRNEDLVFALINSVSRGKGQDLFLRSFHESLLLIQERKLQVPSIHAVIVGSDMSAQTKFDAELRNFVSEKNIQDGVHFVNKTLTVAPYLASIDVLVQNSQLLFVLPFHEISINSALLLLCCQSLQVVVTFRPGESVLEEDNNRSYGLSASCTGIPAGTAAGGTMEIVVNGTTGLLHPVGKQGVRPLANNIVQLATNVEKRLTMGKKGYERVKESSAVQCSPLLFVYYVAGKKIVTMSDGDDAVRRRNVIADYRKKLLQHKEYESRVRAVIVKASSGPRYVVGCRSKVDKEKLTSGTRVVDPVVYNMLHEDPGIVSYSAVGGLSDQIRELKESIELSLMNPELFLRVGIKPPKGVLLYGPPGTGKTLLARAIASNIDANFLKVVSSAIDKYIGESARLI
ncbi:hypothetical protein CRYUN_Cryun30bG0019300 [Craigia yunnanensis]